MPPYQTMLARLNELTTPDAIRKLKEKFDGDSAAILKYLKKELPAKRDHRRVLDAWPPALQKALEAVVLDNVGRDEPFLMQWAWKPSYDYELTVYETPSTTISGGGITVVLGSRYPLDEHPGDIGKPSYRFSPATKLARTLKRASKRKPPARSRKKRR